MSATTNCDCNCADAVNTQVPGTQGVNAYTTTTANFTIPAIGATVVISVGNTQWMAVGQKVIASDGTDFGTFEVQSIGSTTQFTGEFMGYTDDASPGAVVGSGATVSPSGAQQTITLPLPIADGGTGAATKAAAIAALGVGQAPVVDNNAAIAYDITNSAAQVTGVAAVAASTGLYLILARVTVLFTGVTFAAPRTITLTVRNATAAANIVSTTRTTPTVTTTNYPSIDYVLPYVTSTLAASDSIQIYASMDVVESAGSSVITDATIILVPIAV